MGKQKQKHAELPKRVKIVLELSEFLNSFTEKYGNEWRTWDFVNSAISEGFEENEVIYFFNYMIYNGGFNFNKKKRKIEYTPIVVRNVEEHKRRITQLARIRLKTIKELKQLQELWRQKIIKYKDVNECLYNLKKIENTIHFAIINKLVDEVKQGIFKEW